MSDFCLKTTVILTVNFCFRDDQVLRDKISANFPTAEKTKKKKQNLQKGGRSASSSPQQKFPKILTVNNVFPEC